MKKEIYQRIKIPEGVSVTIEGAKIFIKGSEGEISRDFRTEKIDLKKENTEIVVGHKKATKKEKRVINAIVSHIKNMIKGVQKKFEYHLKICYSHFPVSVEFKNKELLIKNFLGEKVPRKTHIPSEVDLEISKDIIIVKSVNKELAGQTSANIEAATRIRKRDRRVFQDGIFIINKPEDKENA